MKIELSRKEIETMLMLIYESLSFDTKGGSNHAFSLEEIAIIDKLERNLKFYENGDAQCGFETGDVCH